MAKVKREQLSGKLLEIYDKIQSQLKSDNEEIVKKAKQAEDKFEKKIEELKAKKEKEASKGKTSKPKAKAKPKKKPKRKPKPKAKAKPKKKHFMTRVKELAEKEGVEFAEARKRLSKQEKKETKEKEQEAKKELDELLKLVRSPKANQELKYEPRKKETNSKAGKTTSKSSDAKRQAKPIGKRKSKSGKVYYEYRENRSDVNSVPTKKGYKYKGKTPPFLEKGGEIDGFTMQMIRGGGNTSELKTNDAKIKMEKGGRVISVVNRDEDFEEERYEAIFGDYDGDGVLNINDVSPLDSNKKGKVEPVDLSKSFSKLVKIKNELDGKMFDALNKLDKKAPKGAELYARTKTPYSIVKKLIDKRLMNPKKGLTDLIGTTIAVDNQKDLEKVKKQIQGGSMGKVLDFDDFYKKPNNGYRAYHFIVEYEGTPVEIQLKTKMQKKLNEVSHEFYKDGTLDAKGLDEVSKMIMQADKGDKKVLAKVKKLMADKDGLKKKLTTSKMAMGGKLDSVADAIFKPNQKRGKIQTQFGDKTLRGLKGMIENDSYEAKEIARAIFFPNSNLKTNKIETSYGFKSIVGLESMVLDARSEMAMGGTVDDDTLMMKTKGTRKMSFGSGGSLSTLNELVGTTGAMTEMDLFEKGGKITSFGLSFSKNDYDVNVNPRNLEVDVNIKESDTVDQFALNDTDAEWEQHGWGYLIKPEDEQELYDVLKALKTNVSKKRLSDWMETKGEKYAKGGQTKKRPKSALMRDRKYYNENESWERQYSKGKNRKGYKKKAKGGRVSKGKNIMAVAKQIRKDGEKWTDAVKRAGKIVKQR